MYYGQYNQLTSLRENKIRIRAVIYSRCSSDEQKKNGYTVKDQLVFGNLFAKDNDLVVVNEYVDEGISATLEIHKRKALAQLIEDAKAGLFEIVILKCIDRFFRNVEEYYACMKQLRKAGVTWLSIEESDLDPADPEAAFKINMYLTLAEYEARKASKRVLFNNSMRIKNKQVVTGDHCFFFPWSVVGEHGNKYLIKNPEMIDATYDILDHFEMHQSKSATLAYTNKKYGMEMSLNTFTHLLQDTLLYGEYKGTADYVEPYITKERFDRIQDIMTRNARYPKRDNNVFIFTGIVRCRCCGYRLVGNYQANKGRKPCFVYRCNKARRDKACDNNHAIIEWKIEEQMLANIETYIKDEIARVETITEIDSVIADNTKKIEAVRKEMSRLNISFRKGRIEEDEYDKEYEVLAKELRELEKVELPEKRDLTAIKKLLESDFMTIYESLDKEHKKAFWRSIIKEFTIGEDRKIVPESIIFF